MKSKPQDDGLTPLMRQYMRIRRELPDDVILMFRLGDFYEMFCDDAIVAAPILGVALTKRAGAPLCGVPYHQVEIYLAKIVRAGRKAAICEQMEDPATAKGIVRREITRIVTPGSIIEESLLVSSANNFLASFAPPTSPKGMFGVALIDLSTGDFSVEACASAEDAAETLRRNSVTECIIGSEEAADFSAILRRAAVSATTPIDDWHFSLETAREALLRHFGVSSLAGYGCEGDGVVGSAPMISAAGALLEHVRTYLHRSVEHVRRLHVRSSAGALLLDCATCANLDLFPTPLKPRSSQTLLDVLNATKTSMGERLLRRRLERPFSEYSEITARHDAVEAFCRDRAALGNFRAALKDMRDLERIITRIGSPQCSPRDLQALGLSLRTIPELKKTLASVDDALIKSAAERMEALPELADELARAIAAEPAVQLHDGGIIAQGYSAQLDELRVKSGDAHSWLAKYQAEEQKRTGITTLKVRHNKVFGYYIEVSKSFVDRVPADYERRQTIVGGERYITGALKKLEDELSSAEAKAFELEFNLFCALREKSAAQTASIQTTAAALAEVDLAAAFADRALALGYTRPEMHTGDEFSITAGRHPIIEQMPDAERFIPNDTLLDCSRNQIALITGPNMAGKSTYIRQVAMIAIMAHAGSFVPADRARIPLMDRVFTRVGAGDDLIRGRSTFMVEMQETANILNNATPRSLIVLDEIGRGTSTFDGISIAWAVTEFLHNTPAVKAKTLFATHYHELTDLAFSLNGVRNYSISVRERGDGIVFLRRITSGPADKSYGIHVARLAGLPQSLVRRANQILANLEENELQAGKPKLASTLPNPDNPDQGLLF